MEEIIYVVDEEDKFVRKATRKEVRENALMHRSVRVIIMNEKGHFLVQKRSMSKDVHPGLWDIGVAGTVKDGDSYESTAIMELLEELGIYGLSNIELVHSLLFKVKYRSPNHNVHIKVYKIEYDGKLKLQKEEVDETEFITIGGIKKLIEEGQFSPVGKFVFENYLELIKKRQAKNLRY